jgi:hypothetical protein
MTSKTALRKILIKPAHVKFLSAALWMFCGLMFQSVYASPERVIYSLDFSTQPESQATNWLRKQGFDFKLDADELKLHFADQELIIETNDQVAGLIVKEVSLPKTKRIRIHWGVDRYPQGANWEQGMYRVPVAIMISFGKEKIDSGAFFLPDAPYFIGLFLGEKEFQGKAYTAKYYKEGGRYFCLPCGTPTGKSTITDFDLEKAFRSQFNKSEMPPISSFGLQMNTKNTKGGARAFIRKIEFLSS